MPVGQFGEPEPFQLLAIPKRIDRGHNPESAAGLYQTTNTSKNFRIGQKNRPEQAAPREIDRNPIGNRGEFTRKILNPSLNEHRVRKSAFYRFASDPDRGLFKRLLVRIYSYDERFRFPLGQVQNETPIARTKVNSDLSIRADTFLKLFPR